MKASQIPDRTVIVYHYRCHICVPCHSPQQSAAAGTLPEAGVRRGSLLSYLPRTIPGESVLPSVQRGSTAGLEGSGEPPGSRRSSAPGLCPCTWRASGRASWGLLTRAADLTAQGTQRSKPHFHIISGTHLNVRGFDFQVDWIPLWKILIQFINTEGKYQFLLFLS